jgi:two-component system response regulator TctD
MRILIVEDEIDLADALAKRLKKSGYAIDSVFDGTEANEFLRHERYDLVVLDLVLPGVDGRSVLRSLRAREARTPVLVLTVRSEIDDKVSMLDLGADDYITKPFDLREFEARCRALLRRPQGMASSSVQSGNLTFDAAGMRVEVAGRSVELSSREFRLLELFMGHLGQVMGKKALIEQLFGIEEAVAPNAIELYVSRLRRKLEGASVEIRTVRGTGYVAETHGSG